MKLYELSKETRALEELFMMSIDEETGEVFEGDILAQLQIELQTQLQKKSCGLIQFMKNTELYVDAVDVEIKRLQNLKKRGSKNLDNFKSYVIRNMEIIGTKKIETTLGNLVLRPSVATEIFDNKLIPHDDRWYSTEEIINEKFDKAIMKKLIQDGVEIPGVRIVEKNNLNIK